MLIPNNHAPFHLQQIKVSKSLKIFGLKQFKFEEAYGECSKAKICFQRESWTKCLKQF